MTTTQTLKPEMILVSGDVKLERVNSEHYKMLSWSTSRIYNLTYNLDKKLWQCDCPDQRHKKAEVRDSDPCKHLIVFRVWLKAAAAEKRAQEEQTKRESAESQIYSLSLNMTDALEEQSTLLQCALIEIELLKREQEREKKAHVEVASAHDIIIAELRYEKLPELNKHIATLIATLKEQAQQIDGLQETIKHMAEAIGHMQQEREQASLLIQASASLINAMQSQQQALQAPQKRITVTIDGEKVRARRTSPTSARQQPAKKPAKKTTSEAPQLEMPQAYENDPGAKILLDALNQMALEDAKPAKKRR